MTGSGKSTFNRLLTYGALGEGYRLLLGDLGGVTFPMLGDHPSLLAPIATSPTAMLDVVERALGECEHRQELYDQAPDWPEKLEEYNAIAVHEGMTPLPRLLVILDEFNAAVSEGGGHNGPLAKRTAELGWQGRKFGISLVLSAQDFAKNLVGRVRDQMNRVVCFRVKSEALARHVGCAGAAKIPEGRPGLAVTSTWGPMQAYHLDKALLIRAGTETTASPGFTSEERALIARSLRQEGGRMSIPLLVRWGVTEWEARQLLKEWEVRGWVEKDPHRKNARYVTDRLRDLTGSLRELEVEKESFEAD
jgi:hypothetical protein